MTICASCPPMRKTNLARLLARRSDGIPGAFEQGEIGPDLFRKPANSGLKGLFRSIESGPTGRALAHWLKVKNPKHPAMNRVKDVHCLK